MSGCEFMIVEYFGSALENIDKWLYGMKSKCESLDIEVLGLRSYRTVYHIYM